MGEQGKPNSSTRSKIGECEYHLCDKKEVEVFRCPFCGRYFCKEHLKPKVPSAAPFRTTDRESMMEWHKKGGHPCPDYVDMQEIKKRVEKEKIGQAFESLSRTPIPVTKEEKIESPTVSYKRESSVKKRKPYRGTRRGSKRLTKIHKPLKIILTRLSTTAKIFYISLIIFIILHVILMYISSRELQILYIIFLCATEIAGLLWLLFKLDRIRIHTTLRLWGLRILAALIAASGISILILLLTVSMNLYFLFLFNPTLNQVDSLVALLSFLPIFIPGIGLLGVGAYLEFKFKRGAGIIVFRG